MHKILPWRVRAVFILPSTYAGWLEVDQELDMGCQLLTPRFCVEIAGVFLAVVLTRPGQPQKPCLTKRFEHMEPFPEWVAPLFGQDFYQTYARITSDQGSRRFFEGPCRP